MNSRCYDNPCHHCPYFNNDCELCHKDTPPSTPIETEWEARERLGEVPFDTPPVENNYDVLNKHTDEMADALQDVFTPPIERVVKNKVCGNCHKDHYGREYCRDEDLTTPPVRGWRQGLRQLPQLYNASKGDIEAIEAFIKQTLEDIKGEVEGTYGGSPDGYHGYLVLPDCKTEKHGNKCARCILADKIKKI